MVKKYIFPIVLFLMINSGAIQAQELSFDISINTPKLQTADPKVFQTLESALESFLNNRIWTDDSFEQEERIECSIQLTINEELSETSFTADLAIQSVRPTFGSNYKTVLLNHVDKNVVFNYEQYQPLEYSDAVFNDNLTSILSFYIYIILGMDYDSFSPLGGELYFQEALEILNTIPSNLTSTFKGWRQLDGNRNRFWIIDNLLNPKIKDYRLAMYDYHRNGLDVISKDSETAKAVLVTALESLGTVNRSYPNAMILQMFSNAKSDEIIEIFKLGSRDQKATVNQVMTKIDASQASKYRAIGR